ncbi:polymer-forming cytoskeletal protein [Candidatus Saccharibacteria bacterium]|nr:polymer-forming cytoskeletal protein [Candidatus Saccharibacteria bacterium]
MLEKQRPFDYRHAAGFYFSALAQVSGSIVETEDIVIDGNFQGTISTTGFCEISENGVVDGSITARSITIFGSCKGEITAQDTVVVKKSATINGSIFTPYIDIEGGADINARIKKPIRDNSGQ